MNQWTADREARPDLAPRRRSPAWRIAAAVALIAVLVAAYYFYLAQRPEPPMAPPLPAPPPQATAEAPAPASAAEPAIRYPIAPPQAATALPELDRSDAAARAAIVELIGRQAFERAVLPNELVRRIVATVDNLPRASAPRRKIPLERVPGAFAVAGAEEERALGAANFARYAPFVHIVESVSAASLVQRYVDAYPLFQRAYEELGYPNKHFNDRLIEAIDDLLAAPEVKAPLRLVQPRVLYEFADPSLEQRSAGQKIMLRMGLENAARVKAKLREIRRALTGKELPTS